MTYLRERMGRIVAFGIGFALLAFVGEEAIRQGNSIFGNDRNTLGEVAGEKIAYDEYSKRVEASEAQFKQQSGQANLNAQFTAYMEENVWNQEVIIYKLYYCITNHNEYLGMKAIFGYGCY